MNHSNCIATVRSHTLNSNEAADLMEPIMFRYISITTVVLLCLVHSTRSALEFPMGTSNGFLIAIAIPLEVPGRNIYLSHNFEMNYVLPSNATQYRLWYNLFKNTKYNVAEAVRRRRNIPEKSSLSRRFVYELLAERMDLYGYNGTACIHKAICETFDEPFYHYNGVLGDIAHVVFSPSASEDEELPRSYYIAEIDGHMKNCVRYGEFCPTGIFDLVSVVTHA
ncbi:uncharacterized protein LOC134227130 [Armigeres subalbatus]|uniref:uncharacterized protein LOC134227130 n=1 Tax=Armigeres subalbatus TaxID=124917 RepID=UPI002ED39B5B